MHDREIRVSCNIENSLSRHYNHISLRKNNRTIHFSTQYTLSFVNSAVSKQKHLKKFDRVSENGVISSLCIFLVFYCFKHFLVFPLTLFPSSQPLSNFLPCMYQSIHSYPASYFRNCVDTTGSPQVTSAWELAHCTCNLKTRRVNLIPH